MTSSETQNLTNGSYPPGTHPDLPPPSSAYGPVHWIKVNLFGGVTNTVLTLLFAYMLWKMVPFLTEWMFLDAAFTGESRRDCEATAGGACWAFIGSRLQLFIYGFYPEAQRWRVDLTFVMLILALVPVLYDATPHRGKGLIFACLYPFIGGWLLIGGLGLE